jgi:hypothetical protein
VGSPDNSDLDAVQHHILQPQDFRQEVTTDSLTRNPVQMGMGTIRAGIEK